MTPPPNAPIKVLYINHYGTFGGAQRSILEMLSAFPSETVDPYFISPRGSVLTTLEKMNIPYTTIWGGISKFDHTRVGYYRGLRWFILLREILYLFPTVYTFLKIKKKIKDFDIIHINEITCILPLILAKRMFKKPVIVHARAVMNNDLNLRRTRIIKRIFEKYADRIIAIDETVAASIPVSSQLYVIHNGFSFDSVLTCGADNFADNLKKIPRRRITLGFIGAIHANKGIFDLLEAVKMCREHNMDVNLIVAGNGNSRRKKISNKLLKALNINQDGDNELYEFIDHNQLGDFIHTLGFSTNTCSFFHYIDTVCFPSYYNALGRPVFEAAFFHRPAIVAIKNPSSDTFIEDKTGLIVEEKDPVSIFNAISIFYHQPELINKMGDEAYELAVKNFDIKKNAKKILDIYVLLCNNN